MDFGDLDISDLAPPPLERTSEPMEPVEEPEETVPVRAPAFASPVGTVSAGASGLEDLQVNDLNLDAADELAGVRPRVINSPGRSGREPPWTISRSISASCLRRTKIKKD